MVALAHDYLTQRGGAERVVLELLRAYPGAPLYTATHLPSATFPEFSQHEIHTSVLNRVPAIRADHRLGLPLYAPVFSRMRIEADLVICSSSGWAHGVQATGRKVVYCHNPARWLYQQDEYLRDSHPAIRAISGLLAPSLRRWDRKAAATADVYLANSTVVAGRVRAIYGIEATVLPPPPALTPDGEQREVAGVEPGFFLCVARLHAYKNVDALMEAFCSLPAERLVVVGDGPYRDRLLAMARPNMTFLHRASDAELRWLYANSRAVLAASYEDYGLTPLEAAAFGRPVAVLRWGGYLDTVVEGGTGVFFDRPAADAILPAIEDLLGRAWSDQVIRSHSELFSRERFVRRLHGLIEAAGQPTPTGGQAG
ncbi:MAG: glycosyltransferase [Pseudonocardiales bacterium]